MRLAAARGLVADGARGFLRHDAMSLAASIAFYTLFSLAPTLVMVVALAGMIFGEDAVRGEIVRQFGGMIGKDSAAAVEEIIARADRPASGTVAIVAGLATLLVGASGAFGELKRALNLVWEATPQAARSGVWAFLRARLLSLAMILVMAFLLLVSLAVSAALSAASAWAGERLGVRIAAAQAIDTGLGLVVSWAMFAAIYRVLPDVRLSWRDVAIGALFTALLFVLGKRVVGVYLGESGAGSVYGAAGAVIVVVLWVYYAAIILLAGAELTRSFAARFGSLRGANAGAHAGAPGVGAGR